MKYCTQCGASLQDTAQFCSSCGTKQAAEPVSASAKPEPQQQAYSTSSSTPIEKILNTEPTVQTSSVEHLILIGLCVCTIISSLIGIGEGLSIALKIILAGSTFSAGISMLILFYVIINAGTLAGAILMLKRNDRGYKLYMAAQGLFFAIVIIAFLSHAFLFERFMNATVIITAAASMLAYTFVVRKQFRKF